MKDRKILENVVLVQEAIHTNYRDKEKGMVVKLYMANTFDRVQHSFPFQVMEHFRFS